MSYGSSTAATATQVNTQPREGGYQMRLLEIFKMTQEAHGLLSQIEQATGTTIPPTPTQASNQLQGPMNLDRVVGDINSNMRDVIERLNRVMNCL